MLLMGEVIVGNPVLNVISNLKYIPNQGINPEIAGNVSKVVKQVNVVSKQNVAANPNYCRKIIAKLEKTPEKDVFTPSSAPVSSSVDLVPKNHHRPRNSGDKNAMAAYFDNSQQAEIQEINERKQAWIDSVVEELENKK